MKRTVATLTGLAAAALLAAGVVALTQRGSPDSTPTTAATDGATQPSQNGLPN